MNEKTKAALMALLAGKKGSENDADLPESVRARLKELRSHVADDEGHMAAVSMNDLALMEDLPQEIRDTLEMCSIAVVPGREATSPLSARYQPVKVVGHVAGPSEETLAAILGSDMNYARLSRAQMSDLMISMLNVEELSKESNKRSQRDHSIGKVLTMLGFENLIDVVATGPDRCNWLGMSPNTFDWCKNNVRSMSEGMYAEYGDKEFVDGFLAKYLHNVEVPLAPLPAELAFNEDLTSPFCRMFIPDNTIFALKSAGLNTLTEVIGTGGHEELARLMDWKPSQTDAYSDAMMRLRLSSIEAEKAFDKIIEDHAYSIHTEEDVLEKIGLPTNHPAVRKMTAALGAVGLTFKEFIHISAKEGLGGVAARVNKVIADPVQAYERMKMIEDHANELAEAATADGKPGVDENGNGMAITAGRLGDDPRKMIEDLINQLPPAMRERARAQVEAKVREIMKSRGLDLDSLESGKLTRARPPKPLDSSIVIAALGSELIAKLRKAGLRDLNRLADAEKQNTRADDESVRLATLATNRQEREAIRDICGYMDSLAAEHDCDCSACEQNRLMRKDYLETHPAVAAVVGDSDPFCKDHFTPPTMH